MLLLAANHPTIKFGTLNPGASLMLDNLDESKKRLNPAATLQAIGRESSIYTFSTTADRKNELLACAPVHKPGSLIVKGRAFRLFGASPYILRSPHRWQQTVRADLRRPSETVYRGNLLVPVFLRHFTLGEDYDCTTVSKQNNNRGYQVREL